MPAATLQPLSNGGATTTVAKLRQEHAAPPLTWIHTTGTEDDKDKHKRRTAVRSHVMYRFNRQKSQRKRALDRVCGFRQLACRPDSKDREHELDHPSTISDPDSDFLLASFGPLSLLVPDCSQLDPFDSTSVKLDPYLNDTLLFYIRCTPKLVPDAKEIKISEYDILFQLALHDCEFMYSLMLTASVIRDRMLVRETSHSTLYYKAKSFESVRKHMTEGSNPSITAICGLLAASTIGGELHQADIHMNALHRLVEHSGGIEAFDDKTQKVLAWVDFQNALTRKRAPRWPYISKCDRKYIHRDFFEHTITLSRASTATFPKDAPGLDQIRLVFDNLFQLDQMASPRWASLFPADALMDLSFETRHILLSLLAQQNRDALFVTKPKPESIMMQIIALTCEIYFKTMIGHTRFKGGITHLLVHRFVSLLKDMGPDPCVTWQSLNCLEALLWALFVAVDACPPERLDAGYLLAEMTKAIGILDIKCQSQFETTLKIFPWTSQFLSRSCESIWTAATSPAALSPARSTQSPP